MEHPHYAETLAKVPPPVAPPAPVPVPVATPAATGATGETGTTGVTGLTGVTGSTGATAVTALPADAGNAPAPAGAVPNAVQPDAVLSVLEPEGTKCDWLRIDVPSGERHVVAVLNAPCSDDESVAWHVNNKQALVHAGGETVWRVKFDTNEVKALPIATPGHVMGFGCDQAMNPVILTIEKQEPDKTGALHFKDQAFPVPRGFQGTPALAHAFVLAADGEMQHREVALTDSDGHGDGHGVEALDAWKLISESSRRMAPPQTPIGDEVEDKALVKHLNSLFDIRKKDEEEKSGWIQLQTIPSSYLYKSAEDFHYATAFLAIAKGDEPAGAPRPFAEPASTLLDGEVRSPYILLQTIDRRRPRLFDVRTSKIIFQSEKGGAAMYWPSP